MALLSNVKLCSRGVRLIRVAVLTKRLTAGVAGALPAVVLQGGELLVRLAQLPDAVAGGEARRLTSVRATATREPSLETVQVILLKQQGIHFHTQPGGEPFQSVIKGGREDSSTHTQLHSINKESMETILFLLFQK